MEARELVIIGAGPAGLTAGIYAKRSGLDVVVLEKGAVGGQINLTDKISNWPGVESTSGMELSSSFRKHALALGVEIRDCEVPSVRSDGENKIIETNKGIISAKALVIATGARFRKLGCPGEAEYTGAGVSYCAVCDAAFFEGLEVAVVGGGNAAVEEAEYLTNFASKVYLIHRRGEFRADKSAVDAVLGNEKIVPVMNTVVESIDGDEGFVSSLKIKNLIENTVSQLPVSGVFVFVGTEPVLSLGRFEDSISRDKFGWIITDDSMATNIPGVYAAGDVRAKGLRQVVTAVSDGAVSAMSAYKYIRNPYFS